MIKYGTNNIGKIYFGNNLIGKAYLGSNLVFSSGSGPQPTTSVAYIRGGADGSYIDTGISPDSTTRVIVWARNYAPASSYLCGSRVSPSSTKFYVASFFDNTIGKIRFDYSNVTAVTADATAFFSGYHKYEIYGGTLKIDDVEQAAITASTFSSSIPMHLFGINNNGTHSGTESFVDICACKIYKNGTLVRDFTPVGTPSVGFYDAVSQTVFSNDGSGSFTYGTFNPDAYIPLEYIKCTGAQYFDTGVAGGYSLFVVSKVSANSSTAKWNIPWSARYDTSNRCEYFFGNTTTANSSLNAGLGSSFPTIKNQGYQNKNVILLKNKNVFTAFNNGSQLGTQTISCSSSYTTGQTLIIGGTFETGSFASAQAFEGKIYYAKVGAVKNFVPAKVNNVAGFYDTFNDVFYSSDSGTAFVAGPQIGTFTHFFRNKNISIIGDSISTYNADGYKYDSYSMYYPTGDVTSVDLMYWKRLMDYEGSTLEVNLSYSGSRATNTDANKPSLCDRVSLIGNCDVVIIALGTNDSTNNVSLGNYSYNTAVENLSETTFRDAYIKGIKQLQAAKPNVDIVCVILMMKEEYAESIREIANHYNLKVVECLDYPYANQVHPTAEGMRQIFNEFLYI